MMAVEKWARAHQRLRARAALMVVNALRYAPNVTAAEIEDGFQSVLVVTFDDGSRADLIVGSVRSGERHPDDHPDTCSPMEHTGRSHETIPTASEGAE